MKRLLIALAAVANLQCTAAPSTHQVYISASGSGVYRAGFDPETGKLSQPGIAAELGAGSWIAPHPSEPVIYVSFSDSAEGGVAALRIRNDGGLEKLNTVALPPGSATHIDVNPAGTLLATSHWGGEAGTLVRLGADGTLLSPALLTKHTLDQPGPGPRQNQPRPHYAAFTADGTKVHQVDLGTDEIWTFDVSADPLSQTLRHKVKVPAGYGPRHLAFHPTKPFAYISQELGSKISAFHYDSETAVFTPLQHLDSKGPADTVPYNNTSHVLVHPSGGFAYIGNRGHDSIGVFVIDQTTGKLAFVETESARGHWPRNFAIDPSGRWLLVASMRSSTIGVMEIDQETGALTFQLDSVVTVPRPVCILFR